MFSEIYDDIKEWSVKVYMSETEYTELKDTAYYLEISLKKLINKSIKFALNDIKKGYFCRSQIVKINCERMKEYSFKIKSKHYEKIKLICKDMDLNAKDLVRDILSYYPKCVKEYEDRFMDDD